MAQQQIGDNVDLQFLRDGSVLFVTTDELISANSIEFVTQIAAVGITFPETNVLDQFTGDNGTSPPNSNWTNV